VVGWLACIIALVALATLHFWWRGKFLRGQEHATREIERLKLIRQQQELSAVQSQSRQKAVFNSMVEGLLLLDENSRVQLANRAFKKLFGMGNEVVGKTVLEVLRSNELPKMIDALGAHQRWLEREIKFPGASERWLHVSAATVLDVEEKREGTILVFHDQTRLKQLERTREEFVANVSHELRTPLSHIKGYVETLLSGAKDDPQVSVRFLQTIERNAERLKLLIEDLLTISELESGRVQLNLQSFSLRSVVEKVAEDFKARAAAKSVSLAVDLPDLRVQADAGRVDQVLANLVDNAIKYGRAGGHVRIGARESNAQVEVCVQDDGPGLPAEALERVFERFYRVDKARSREQGGTGLGLSIVKHIVQTHGGKVWATSDPGRGATFFFTLPAAQ